MSRARTGSVPCRRRFSRREMMSSNITIERLCWVPPKSVRARNSVSSTACTSRWTASDTGGGLGCCAAAGLAGRPRPASSPPRKQRTPPRRFVIYPTPRNLRPARRASLEPHHLLQPIVVDQDRPGGVEGQCPGLLQLLAPEDGEELPLLREDVDPALLVGDVQVPERIHRQVARLAQLEPGPPRPH